MNRIEKGMFQSELEKKLKVAGTFKKNKQEISCPLCPSFAIFTFVHDSVLMSGLQLVVLDGIRWEIWCLQCWLVGSVFQVSGQRFGSSVFGSLTQDMQ